MQGTIATLKLASVSLALGVAMATAAGCAGGQIDETGSGAADEAAVRPKAETVVNLFDLGVVRAYVPSSDGSVTTKTLTSSDLLSCTFVNDPLAPTGRYAMAYIDIVPEVGKKYVLPIKQDSTCLAGWGLNGFYMADHAIFGEVVVTLEDIATGTTIPMTKPNGCTYASSFSKAETGFTTDLDPPNSQLVIRATKDLTGVQGGADLSFTLSPDEVAQDCAYYGNW